MKPDLTGFTVAEKAYLALACEITEASLRSEREFDIEFSGQRGDMKFSAWLPLDFIRDHMIWTKPHVADMTDYSFMVEQGDWSGVRDSSVATIWRVFEHGWKQIGHKRPCCYQKVAA